MAVDEATTTLELSDGKLASVMTTTRLHSRSRMDAGCRHRSRDEVVILDPHARTIVAISCVSAR